MSFYEPLKTTVLEGLLQLQGRKTRAQKNAKDCDFRIKVRTSGKRNEGARANDQRERPCT